MANRNNINRSEILKAAWARYRAIHGTGKFNRARFAHQLSMAWAKAKQDAALVAVTGKAAKIAEIDRELRKLELASDRMDWARANELGAERARLAV